MQIFIRSQDKKRLMQLGEVHLQEVEAVKTYNPNSITVAKEIVGGNIFINGFLVAKYNTIERAREVMDELCNLIARGGVFIKPNEQSKSNTKIKNNETGIIKADDISVNQLNSLFYQMPEK